MFCFHDELMINDIVFLDRTILLDTYACINARFIALFFVILTVFGHCDFSMQLVFNFLARYETEGIKINCGFMGNVSYLLVYINYDKTTVI